MMEISTIRDGVIRYVYKHMMPKMDSKSQFLLGMALGTISGRVDELMGKIAQNETAKALGIISEEGVDYETIIGAAMAQMQQQKKLVLDVPVIGRLTFDEQDLRDLHQCIKGGV